MLGTGTPIPSAERAGSGFAVIYGGEAYMFDVGHGTVQRAIQAWKTMDAPELNPPKIKNVFLTHLHSDHTMDYSELASTYWWRRENRFSLLVIQPCIKLQLMKFLKPVLFLTKIMSL